MGHEEPLLYIKIQKKKRYQFESTRRTKCINSLAIFLSFAWVQIPPKLKKGMSLHTYEIHILDKVK